MPVGALTVARTKMKKKMRYTYVLARPQPQAHANRSMWQCVRACMRVYIGSRHTIVSSLSDALTHKHLYLRSDTDSAESFSANDCEIFEYV